MNPLRAIRTRISIARIAAALKRAATARGYPNRIMWYRAYYIHPRHMVFWICVGTDSEKERLRSDEQFWTSARGLLAEYAYPSEGRDGVQLGVESQETVAREANGNWWLYMK